MKQGMHQAWDPFHDSQDPIKVLPLALLSHILFYRVRNRLGPKYPFLYMNGWNKPIPRCPSHSPQIEC